ncbi:hypothetical protein [Hyalangium minutum]|uniref:Uncharacterized protein n=1 Tax=Hyalangium minutum TaxID=394096 RepID=A0A085W8H5_9BACT|nr:hypothetical protein [Hyalangium minutum]KFE63988.1 hypothetical protein DB31_2400 [Hyalangium minutum]
MAQANPEQCEARCATRASTEMESCLGRCPEAGDPTQARGVQACAVRCKDRFDSAFNACAEHCPQKDGSADTREKKRQQRRRPRDERQLQR